MDAIKINTIIKKDGEIKISGVPLNKGQEIEMIILSEPISKKKGEPATGYKLLHSDIIGIWENRDDIKDSSEYARKLRDISQHRKLTHDNA
jgi:hypothetical protein